MREKLHESDVNEKAEDKSRAHSPSFSDSPHPDKSLRLPKARLSIYRRSQPFAEWRRSQPLTPYLDEECWLPSFQYNRRTLPDREENLSLAVVSAIRSLRWDLKAIVNSLDLQYADLRVRIHLYQWNMHAGHCTVPNQQKAMPTQPLILSTQ